MRARIFTPTREMLFAGHPTIGASFVLLDEGIVPKGTEQFVLDEKIGPVPIRVESGDRPLIWLTTPPIQDGAVYNPRHAPLHWVWTQPMCSTYRRNC